MAQAGRMDEVRVSIDGREVSGHEGLTILEAAQTVAIEIPTLCFHPDLIPTGNCRVCAVEVEGARTLVGACHTPIANGMVIHTRSPRVVRARRATVELLMAGHTGECVTDEHTHRCDLRKLADQLEGGAPRFLMRKPRWYPIEELNPYVRRDMSKCILCRKCIGACTEVAKKNLFSIAYRAFDSKVVVDSDEPLTTVACRDCGICIDYCPTGALSKSTRKDDLKGNSFPEGNTLIGKKRELLLEMLKTSQNQFGYVSREFMAQTAQSLDLSVSEVYGVTTFYSFLSTRPLGRNVIRICKSIPCCLKDAERVIESVAREVGITPGQTTGDGKFSFELTNCIGACDMAPAMLVNHDVYGHLTPGKIAKILRAYE